MKILALFAFAGLIACNNSQQPASVKEDNEAPATGTAKSKSDFMSSCMIDASNPLRTPEEEDKDVPADLERVRKFCECAFEKTKGEYPGPIIANRSKLKKDAVLAPCWQAAH
jgi:hypothetical protein